MIEVPAHLLSPNDRIALKSEMLNEAVIKKINGSDPEIFEAIILSGDESGTLNKNEGTAGGNPKQNNNLAQSYIFTRVRRMDVDEFEKPDPFLAENRQTARKLVNMHPIGILLITPSTSQHPKTGETWSCRYLSEDKKGIVLIDRVGVSSKFLSLKKKDSIYQSAATNWSVGQPQLLGSYDSPPVPNNTPSGPVWVDTGVPPSTAADIARYYPKAAGIADELVAMSGRLEIQNPAWLANLINFESAGTWSPSVRNSKSGATGLIQFMPKTAKGYGTTVEELAKMSQKHQLKYVERYLKKGKGRFLTPVDLYMRVYFPVAMGKGVDYSIYDYYLKKKGKQFADYYKRINGGIETAGDYYIKTLDHSKIPV